MGGEGRVRSHTILMNSQKVSEMALSMTQWASVLVPRLLQRNQRRASSI